MQVNDDVIFSKKQQGRHAEPGEIKRLLDDKVAAYKATQGITWVHPPKD